MFWGKLQPGIEHGILNPDYVPSAIKDFKIAIASQVATNPTMFDSFRAKIVEAS